MSGYKVVIAGGYPPPFGGISVHIQRLASILSTYYDVKVLDFYGKPVAAHMPQQGIELIRIRGNILTHLVYAIRQLCSGHGIVHLHVSAGNNLLRILCFLIAKNSKKLVFTIHSGSFATRLSEQGVLTRSFLRWMLQWFDRIIVVNPQQQEALKSLGVLPSKVVIIPAYLKASGEYSQGIAKRIAEMRSRNHLMLISSGFGLPHYGYHVILQALSTAFQDKKVALILALYNTYDRAYLNELARLAAILKHVEYVVLEDSQPEEFNYVLSQCDMYIRATTVDGDSVAVREALQHGLNVICSDCVARPEGTQLFSLTSGGSLPKALESVKLSRKLVHQQQDNAKELLSIYASIRASDAVEH
ncbi:MAG: glycosyltransferase [Nitrospira sp.]|nr:glycosyltransferase [Nitrospira sp.]